ncbi:hypothetical protein Pyn_31870 [Prunus yedoensis var. nudiflora]|uniref:DUF3444 domain-containing protein n=1 Tax=Prunus yedoensis var. nudiflora TaxID=2094558 RepID=A0A314ZM40_PRUYE|nr:hypothetical protein Pyn_31870 [Prunus yedoensis var. nudiflora]
MRPSERKSFRRSCSPKRILQGRRNSLSSLKACFQSLMVFPKCWQHWMFTFVQRTELMGKLTVDHYSEELGVTIVPLRTVFRKKIDIETVLKTILREEMFRFSHRVPSHRLTVEEAPILKRVFWSWIQQILRSNFFRS